MIGEIDSKEQSTIVSGASSAGQRLIMLRWVYKVKNVVGEVIKHKTSLVVNGYAQ